MTDDMLEAVPEATRERLQAAGVDLDRVAAAAAALATCFRSGGKVLLFGNGGSAADAQHMAAEFVGRFLAERPALAAVALTTDTSALTALANDFGFERVFARQIEALGRPGDVAVAISTSGRSANVVAGAQAARAAGMRSIGVLGSPGSPLEQGVDIAITVSSESVPSIQETHLAIEHALCGAVEALLFGAISTESGSEPQALLGAATKIVDWDRLIALREQWRREGRRVVWTNGVFDLLHVGHVRSFEAAKRLGDVLVVGVNGDASVRAIKGDGRPLVPVRERAEVVAAVAPVDYVVVFDEPTPERALERLQPDVHTKGADYEGRELPERAVVESYGGSIELLPIVPGVSTTSLAQRLRDAGG
jgi:rfaE bifunctional protein nucleotidyltransferase chain/domain